MQIVKHTAKKLKDPKPLYIVTATLKSEQKYTPIKVTGPKNYFMTNIHWAIQETQRLVQWKKPLTVHISIATENEIVEVGETTEFYPIQGLKDMTEYFYGEAYEGYECTIYQVDLEADIIKQAMDTIHKSKKPQIMPVPSYNIEGELDGSFNYVLEPSKWGAGRELLYWPWSLVSAQIFGISPDRYVYDLVKGRKEEIFQTQEFYTAGTVCSSVLGQFLLSNRQMNLITSFPAGVEVLMETLYETELAKKIVKQ